MWKYNIVVPKEYGIIVYRLKSILKNNLSKYRHAQAILEESDKYKYCLIVEEDVENHVKAEVLSYLVDNIIYFYKKDYILKNLKFDYNNIKNFTYFLKALICFDYQLDKEIILDKIIHSSTVYIDSLFNFGIKKLKDKWYELVLLANENYFYINNDETFVQLIKFLMSNIDYRVNTVNVYYKDNRYQFFDQNNNYINDYLLDYPSNDDNFLINSLISLSPKKIKIHCELNNNDYYLYELFNERIEKC